MGIKKPVSDTKKVPSARDDVFTALGKAKKRLAVINDKLNGLCDERDAVQTLVDSLEAALDDAQAADV